MTTVEIILLIEAVIATTIAYIYAWQWGNAIDDKKALREDVLYLIDKHNGIVNEYNELVQRSNRTKNICRLLLHLYNKHREKHNRATRKCKELSGRIKELQAIELPTTERILCAAIWYDDGVFRMSTPANITSGIVVTGFRHSYCYAILADLFPDRDYIINNRYNNKTVQGFLTNKNRFVNREEAGDVAYKAGQIIDTIDYLFSEDLY